MPMKNGFYRHILSRRWAAFVGLGLGFLLFGVSPVNLFLVGRASFERIAQNGWQVLADSAPPLLERVLTGYTSMASYVVFTASEARSVRWLIKPITSAARAF